MERRDEDHYLTALKSKMDTTIAIHVVRLRLFSAMMTETILSSLHGKRIQIENQSTKLSFSAYNVVSSITPKKVTIEKGYCIGPLLLCCLTFSITKETFADFHWEVGAKVDTSVTQLRKPERRLTSHT